MTYDIHPLIVHFPIALLCIYSVIQILPVQKWIPTIAWKQVSTLLLILGYAGALAASSSGEVAEHLSNPNHDVLELHETFAGLVEVFYGILVGSTVVQWLCGRYLKLLEYKVVSIVLMISNFVESRPVSIMLSLLGLIALVLTGVFGGVMVYGTSADPLAAPLLQLFGVSL
jgi:uncharacterized membrane protein